MKNQIDDLLAFDPIDAAEKITGRGLGDDTAMLGLLFQMDKNQRVAAALEEIGDVNSWSQSLETYMNILKAAGFEQLMCDDIPNTNDKFYIFWRNDGVLISFDTYSDHTTVNGGNVYLNFEHDRSDAAYQALSGCSNGPINYNEEDPIVTRTVSLDCRQAVLHKLSKMQQAGTILPKWKQRPFLWFLHYMDTKTDDYDHEAITEWRIGRLPVEVQEAIGPRRKRK